MRKIVLVGMLFASVCASAQLKVDANGRVGLGVSTMNSDFCIGNSGNVLYKMALRATDYGIYVLRGGTPLYTGSQLYGAYIRNVAVADRFNTGIYGVTIGSSTSGRGYGVWGAAGNTTTGYNYGIFGQLTGTQNGAGVYGTTNASDNGQNVDARYAGYFNGDVKVTGTLYAPVVTSTSASSSVATAQVALATNSEEEETVIFDAPEVVFGDNFSCPIGASFETRNEGCKL